MLATLIYHASFSFDLYFLIPAVITQILNLTTELVLPIEITTKEAKYKIQMETQPVTVEMTMSVQYYSKLYKIRYASYLLIHFNLFLS